MNFQKKKKIFKWQRLSQEIEDDLPDTDQHNPEVGADLRWAIIMLRRAISALA